MSPSLEGDISDFCFSQESEQFGVNQFGQLLVEPVACRHEAADAQVWRRALQLVGHPGAKIGIKLTPEQQRWRRDHARRGERRRATAQKLAIVAQGRHHHARSRHRIHIALDIFVGQPGAPTVSRTNVRQNWL